MDTNNRFTDADERRELLGYEYDLSEPVCKFGPGGEFVSYWPPMPDDYSRIRPNALTKLLNKLVPLVKIAPAQPSHQPQIVATPVEHEEHIISSKEQFENAANHDAGDRASHAPPATIIKGDNLFPGQQILFPDDSRARRRAANKPKHHFRAHRRAAKKGFIAGRPRQGSLFEADFKGAKTA